MATSTGDPYVLNVQRWLNNTYGSDSRYKKVTEDGYVGWGTINGLIRALQIRLGIQQTADNFGTGTVNAFKSQFPNGIRQQEDGDETEDNVYGIIQGALLCKGYATGVNTPTLHFYNGTGNAIKKLRRDAGIDDTTSTVTLNIMKALLSMDYFVTYKTDSYSKNIRNIQQYLNRKCESYIGLKPCDGVYSRGTSTALMYALQIEEGLPIGTANGNFGPTTKRTCPSIPYNQKEKNYSGRTYTSTEISNFIILLRMALYVNGFEEENGFTLTGTYNNSLKQLIGDFQKFYALPETNVVDATTWASLLVSYGDTSRSATACDCATILTKEKAKTLYDNGYRYVGRYLCGYVGNGVPKGLSREEIGIAIDAGLNIFPIYQTSGNKVSYFTTTQAEHDAEEALYYANELGIPLNTIIYFAVDCDPLGTQIQTSIIPYFRTLKNLLKSYKIGVYGTRNVCSSVLNANYAENSFVSNMASGWSGNLGFKMPNKWAYDQFTTTTVGTGTGKIEIDKDGFSGTDHGFNSITLSPVDKIADNIQKIFDKALEYTNNNINRSNLLTAQYIRQLNSSYKGTLWDQVGGELDSNFIQSINSAYPNMNFTFYDSITIDNKFIKYDITHFCATLSALLYEYGDGNQQSLDNLSNLYAGWAGDTLSFSSDIKSAEDKGETNLLSWSQNNICKFGSKFSRSDYCADIDAINISKKIKTGISFPAAFQSYFKTSANNDNPEASRRTKQWLSSEGINYLNATCDLLKQDELKMFANLLNKTDGVSSEHISIALEAFKYYANKENSLGR